MARDPVCGVEVDPLRARAVAIFGRRRVYFCSAAHKAEYVADPARFGDAAAVPLAVDKRGSSGKIVDKRTSGSMPVDKRSASGTVAVEKRGASGPVAVDAAAAAGSKPPAAAAEGGAGAPEAGLAPVEEAPAPRRGSGRLLFVVGLLLVAVAVVAFFWKRRHG